MAVTFLGYLDKPEEMLQGKRRCLFGCDSSSDVASLPTTTGYTMPSGGVTAKPAPFSMALVAGGTTQVLKSSGTWGDL